MADKKISALTAASLPLAGTEVLPIVQSGATVKVATDDLTVKNVRSNATTGLLQIAGPGAGTTRVMTTPNANFIAARTDAAQTFSGNQTLGDGNIIQGAAAKGFNFTANTAEAGKTSQLLNWYEEGTWTPTLTINTVGDLAITYSAQTGYYTRIGRLVRVSFDIQTSAFTHTTSSGVWRVAGLPFLSNSNTAYWAGALTGFQGITKANYTQFGMQTSTGSAQLLFQASGSGQGWDYLNAADLPSGGSLLLRGSFEYIL